MTHTLTAEERKMIGGRAPALMPMTGHPVHINPDPNSPRSLERNRRRIERLEMAIAVAEDKGEGDLMGDHRRELAQRQDRARRAAETRKE